MLKLDNRDDFIHKSNGLASDKVPLEEDINKGVPRSNRTNFKAIYPPLRITFESNEMNFIYK